MLSEEEMAAMQALEGVKALISKGFKVVVLAAGKARLFYEGNPVVFGGAIGAVLGDPAAGDIVSVTDHRGKSVGWGIYNPASMYRVRMLWLTSIDGQAGDSRDVAATVSKRLATAVAVRKSLQLPRADTNAYRLVNGEGDRMSGIAIDVYDKLLVFSSSARWVEIYKEDILKALRSHFASEYEIIWRPSKDRLMQDGWSPEASEDIEEDEEVAAVDDGSMVIEELGVKFAIAPRAGQKTGVCIHAVNMCVCVRARMRGVGLCGERHAILATATLYTREKLLPS